MRELDGQRSSVFPADALADRPRELKTNLKKKNQQQAPARCISATETALGSEFCLTLFSPRFLRCLVDGTIPLCKNKKVTKLCGGVFLATVNTWIISLYLQLVK